MKNRKAQDFYLAHPLLDQLLPILGLAIWHFTLKQVVPGSADAQLAAYVGLSAIAGLVLAAATFVCTMIYQSTSPSVLLLREKFSKSLSKNWASIFALTFVAALLPIAATLLHSSNGTLSFALVIYSAAILIGRGARTYTWLLVSFWLEASPGPSERSTTPTTLRPPPSKRNV